MPARTLNDFLAGFFVPETAVRKVNLDSTGWSDEDFSKERTTLFSPRNGKETQEEGGFMKKDRLEWVMSGLNQYNLTKTEDHFIKTVLEDFDKKQALTEHQEEKLESLYKEKSKLTPNKKSSSYFTFAETIPRKARARRSRSKDAF
jgi:hypothetical protein